MLKEITRNVELSLNDIGKLIHILDIEINTYKIRLIEVEKSDTMSSMSKDVIKRDCSNIINDLTSIKQKLIYSRNCEVQNDDNKEDEN